MWVRIPPCVPSPSSSAGQSGEPYKSCVVGSSPTWGTMDTTVGGDTVPALTTILVVLAIIALLVFIF